MASNDSSSANIPNLNASLESAPALAGKTASKGLKDEDSLVSRFTNWSNDYYGKLRTCTPAGLYVLVTLLLWAYYVVTNPMYRNGWSVIMNLGSILLSSLFLLWICQNYPSIVWVIFALQLIGVVMILWQTIPKCIPDGNSEPFCTNCA